MRLGSQSFEPSLNLKRLDLCGLNKEEVVPAIRLMFELLSQSRRGLSDFDDSRRHRKCLEQANEDLREQLQNNPSNTTNLRSALDQQRRVINDIHKRVIAVTKGLEKQPR